MVFYFLQLGKRFCLCVNLCVNLRMFPTQRTRLRRFYAKIFCVIAPNLFSKKAYNRRKCDVKPSKCRDFTQFLTVFSLGSYNGRNIIAKASQRRYFMAILRKNIFCAKRARTQAYARFYVDFTRIFALHSIFFAQKLAHFLLGTYRL